MANLPVAQFLHCAKYPSMINLQNHSMLALLGYAAWTMVLLAGIAVLRSTLVVTQKRRVNSFLPTGVDVSPFAGRLCRAHANCVENLPIFASLILVAVSTGHASLTDSLALWVLAARVGQSVVHLVSTRNRAVLLRFTFFVVQLGVQAMWVVQLLQIR